MGKIQISFMTKGRKIRKKKDRGRKMGLFKSKESLKGVEYKWQKLNIEVEN